jgi:hypothetical protein
VSTLSTTNLKHPSSGSNNIVLDSSGNTRVTAITDSAGANSSTPEAIANGTAKAWVNFDGTGTVAIRAAYNVSSITDNGTGDYTVNFTTALPDADYSVQCVSQLISGQATWSDQAQPDGYTASSVKIYTGFFINPTNTARDHSFVHVAIFR